MKLPLIKDGIVVNVIEIDEATVCVDKAEYKRLAAAEDADYSERYNAYQRELVKRQESISTAKTSHFMAVGAATAIMRDARENAGDAAATLDRVIAANAEVEAWAAKVADMLAQPLPEKPQLVRAARWICPDGHTVGPVGGQMWDAWDGEKYTRPEGQIVQKEGAAGGELVA